MTARMTLEEIKKLVEEEEDGRIICVTFLPEDMEDMEADDRSIVIGGDADEPF